MRSQILSLFSVLLLWNIAQGQTKQSYEAAYKEQLAMLSGKEPVSFKKSVFLTENAYYGGSLNYQAFCQDISNISAQLKKPAAKPRPAKVLNPFEMVHVPDSIRNKLSFSFQKQNMTAHKLIRLLKFSIC